MVFVLKSLSSRVAILLVVAVLLSVGTVAVVTERTHQRQLAAETRKMSKVMVRQTINSMVYAMTQQAPRDIDEVLQWMAHEKVVGVRVLGPDGTIHHSSARAEIGQRVPDLHLGEIQRSTVQLHDVELAGGETRLVVHKAVTNEPRCLACHQADDLRSVLEVTLDTTEITQAAAQARQTSLWLVLAATALALALAWWLVHRYLLRPVQTLVQAMREVEKGALHTRVALRSPDELAELGQSFNRMVMRLQLARAELDQNFAEGMARAERLATVGEMASTMAHEIRNPLAGLLGALGVLRRDPALAGKLDVVDEMESTLKRLADTSQNLLNFAAPPAPTLEACSVNDGLRSVLRLVEQHKVKGPIAFVAELDERIPQLTCDGRQLQQVFLNVCLNGVQAMPDGGTLRVRSQLVNGDRPPCVQVTIADSGPGIPGELVDKIFTPFFTTKHRGTGLGLAISKNIVDQHGGVMRVDSVEGQGATFTIELPVARGA